MGNSCQQREHNNIISSWGKEGERAAVKHWRLSWEEGARKTVMSLNHCTEPTVNDSRGANLLRIVCRCLLRSWDQIQWNSAGKNKSWKTISGNWVFLCHYQLFIWAHSETKWLFVFTAQPSEGVCCSWNILCSWACPCKACSLLGLSCQAPALPRLWGHHCWLIQMRWLYPYFQTFCDGSDVPPSAVCSGA